ncbi:MAG: SulP family inorganic anion transporter [Alphaproteobacteria bacterium]|nr:SulP family inorganic anion transporter [Alphaproteobacteria bacterium]MBU1515737.1 SulP family inorganic anion transporter [Alphaproteobacteria bacterium]MBU2097020.1 SulP family inorganic anion transporter [Alphaproteobacteria bacterium]MBU2149536.1 SulP family inorganic anion transporter [Alphaproteobacteria bacterium]MBU2308922.1 SulP family inorganic anion transporter [Alphaproteobacteria bacterium]
MSHPAAPPAPVLTRGNIFSRDFTASIVVFLVALPLCMGIAIASGVPAEKGLITGIIGGIVVGALAGSPLQVSGPAAGLAVIVFEIVQKHGVGMLGPLLILAGLIQVLAGAMKLGQWFRAISPAVVHGMLAGIGVLIVVGQIHVMFGDSPGPHGLRNLLAIPGAFFSMSPLTLGRAESAFVVGAVTIGAMIGWEKIRPAKLKLVPGALLGVLAGTLTAIGFGLDVQRIAVPESIIAAIAVPGLADFSRMAELGMIVTALAIAFIASAETLLSAAAVDRMHDGPRTKYNKELFAQGVGNMLCGAAGALPMTGVIVRSSANVQAGAVTRMSAIMHGAWILAFVALLPMVLELVPSAALAGILVVTGWRLVGLQHVRHLFDRYGLLPAAIWAATFIAVVSTDLLTGVLIGMALTVLELIPHLRRMRLKIADNSGDGADRAVTLEGAATFLQLPRITKALEAIPDGGVLRLDTRGLSCLDHTCSEVIHEWLKAKRRAGTTIEVSPGPFAARLAGA